MAKQHFDDYLLYQLAMASHAVSNEFHKELTALGVSPAAWRILYCLWSRPGMRLTELASHVLFKQPRVTKRVVQLEKDGLIEKIKDTEDRRNVYLHLTEKGRSLTAPLIEKSQSHEKKILSSLSKTERQQFRKTLKILMSQLQ